MKINKRLRKAFTLVELVVVIAIIAILSTVSVVTYFGITNSAKKSVDDTLIAELNKCLQLDETINGKPNTPSEALEVVEENGFTVEKMTPTQDKKEIVWHQTTNKFELVDEITNKDNATIDTWRFLNQYSNNYGYSVYLKDADFAESDLTLSVETGFDAGKNSEAFQVNYVGSTEAKNLVIRTNSFDSSVNVTAYEVGTVGTENYSCDSLNHYGYAKEVVVNKAGFASYHEYGKVGFLTLHEGKLVAEKEANVVTTYIPDTSKSFDIALNDGGVLKDVYAKKVANAAEANEKITDSKVEVKALTTDDSATEDTITTIVDTKKADSKNEALDSEVNNGGIKVESAFRVGDKGFNSFDEALVAAKETKSTLALQGTTLYENETNKELVKEGETLTIDLNGYEWKPSTTWYTIQNKGTLTIEGGNFNSKGSTVVKNEPNANLTINGGTFELDREQESNYFYNAILNYGTTVINDGSFTSNAGAALWNGNSESNTIGNVTINKGSFVSTYDIWTHISVGAVHDSYGTMVINGGEFIGSDTAVFYNGNGNTKLFIYDGIFSYTSPDRYDPYTFWNNGYEDDAEIYGGTYVRDPDGRVSLPVGYKSVQNSDGTWSVVKE